MNDGARLAQGVLARDRAALGRALTLVESTAEAHRATAIELLATLAPHASQAAMRVGLSGPPGAGKSTLIESLGTKWIARGKSVAVLAIDPSSARSGGSILGDKTRMPNLARDPRAFVRPSPNRQTLGGVSLGTREQRLVLEAAGFDVVIIETVGVGQSEVDVASMVDTFALLWLPDSGDELQGIKRGIMELADVVLVGKADGAREASAHQAEVELRSALRYLAPSTPNWSPRVQCVSAKEERGIEAVIDLLDAHRAALGASLGDRRAEQDVSAMWSIVERRWLAELRRNRLLDGRASELEVRVRAGALPPAVAAEECILRLSTATSQ